MGFIDSPEYGYLITLSGSGEPPADRILYRPAKELKGERDIIVPEEQMTQPEWLRLTQAEVDMAAQLIESPTRFLVKFAMSPNGRNLTEDDREAMYERLKVLDQRIAMQTGSSYDSTTGEYIIYVHQEDAKKAGLTKEKLKQIGEEVMQMPVRIVWEEGYPTLHIATVDIEE